MNKRDKIIKIIDQCLAAGYELVLERKKLDISIITDAADQIEALDDWISVDDPPDPSDRVMWGASNEDPIFGKLKFQLGDDFIIDDNGHLYLLSRYTHWKTQAPPESKNR